MTREQIEQPISFGCFFEGALDEVQMVCLGKESPKFGANRQGIPITNTTQLVGVKQIAIGWNKKENWITQI